VNVVRYKRSARQDDSRQPEPKQIAPDLISTVNRKRALGPDELPERVRRQARPLIFGLLEESLEIHRLNRREMELNEWSPERGKGGETWR